MTMPCYLLKQIHDLWLEISSKSPIRRLHTRDVTRTLNWRNAKGEFQHLLTLTCSISAVNCVMRLSIRSLFTGRRTSDRLLCFITSSRASSWLLSRRWDGASIAAILGSGAICTPLNQVCSLNWRFHWYRHTFVFHERTLCMKTCTQCKILIPLSWTLLI